MSTLTINLVTDKGVVDQKASRQAFESALVKYVAERETELSAIADAVNSVFDEHKGSSINMPAVAGFALQKLNAQPENYKTLETRVMEYVRENAKGDSSTFVIAKGKKGGVTRRADQPTK
jgi:uncharacterized protein YgiB involved in biofilm formation